VIGFNVVYQHFRAMYDSVCQICCNLSILSLCLHDSTPKYHAVDKHDTPSHFKLTPGQPALL